MGKGEGGGQETERQKERSARTAGKPTDQFVLSANGESRLNRTREHVRTQTCFFKV